VQPEDLARSLAQLEAVWLARIEFRENPGFDPERDQDRVRYAVGRETRIDHSESGEASLMTLMARIDWSHVDEGEIPFDLEVDLQGLFAWSSPIDDEDFAAAWLEFNGVYLLWPYLRSHVALITTASSLPPLTIPTLRVPRPEIGETVAEGDDESGATVESQGQSPEDEST
jgi:preprotein translocase subunit SecB